MDISKLNAAVEAIPARISEIYKEMNGLKSELDSKRLFQEAVTRLKTSWDDHDPGKYGPHWYAFKDGKKAWPRELVDLSAVTRHVAEHRKRAPHWPDYDVLLAPLAELLHQDCPSCKRPALAVCMYRQAYDGPDGDLWIKILYLLCAECASLRQVSSQNSSGRF